MYGIYLDRRPKTVPDLRDFQQDAPLVADSSFQARLFPRGRAPGTPGLELPKELARRLLERFRASGSEGYCFPASYHHPRLTIEQATAIAAQEIEQLRVRYDPTDVLLKWELVEWDPTRSVDQPVTFEPAAHILEAVFLHSDGYPCYWEFGAHSARMRKERRIPGGIFTFVDKLDGHIWQPEELKRLREGTHFD